MVDVYHVMLYLFAAAAALGSGEAEKWVHASLWYGQRLEKGLSIGSGLIEGAGKNTLARRLKINSARWRVRRAENMGAIRCLQYSGLWETYWESKSAA